MGVPRAVLELVVALSLAIPAVAYASPPPECAGQPATIIGTSGPDRIVGTNQIDVIVSLGGRDVIETRGNADTVCAGRGADVIVSREGVVHHLYGNGGNDRIYSRRPSYINGGWGDDVLQYQNDQQRDGGVIRGGPGNDRLVGGSGHDQLEGEEGDDILVGRRGHDRLYLSTGSDSIVGGPASDVLHAFTSVVVDLPKQKVTGENIDVSARSVEGLSAGFSTGPVTFIGNGRANSVDGSVYDDVLRGGEGRDRFWPLEGNDVVHGGPGPDYTQEGGVEDSFDGADVIFGGSGDDFLNGGWHDDRLRGGSGADVLRGGAGDDDLNGSGGKNSNDGGDGTDTCVSPNPSEGAVNCEGP